MKLTLHGKTDAGAVREHNEDAYRLDREGGVAIVSDGMGGHAAGDVASLLTVAAFERAMKKHLPEAGDLNAVRALVQRALEMADQEVVAAIEQTPSWQGMGATAVCACLWRDIFVVANVGDSRAYLIRGKKITRITKDHSHLQNLLDEGMLTEEEARTHPQRNLITRYIGAHSAPSVYALEAEPEDRLLLCSDGLVEVLRDEEMLKIVLGARAAKEACRTLVRRAVAGGATDNVTAVLMHLAGKQVRSAKTAYRAACMIAVLALGGYLAGRGGMGLPDAGRLYGMISDGVAHFLNAEVVASEQGIETGSIP